ncbi:MAG: AsmA family protein [Sideroxydans sp.]|nr:AsmA family protein [Sideroxydans sp.]
MNKYLKYGLWTVAGVALLVVAALSYLALTFDPNTYKPQIIQAVKDSKQRTLKLDGDIKLTFFPNIGVSVGQVSLSEFQSEQEFASIESARVSLALLPLLSKQVVVDNVAVSGVKARVIKFKNGKTNLDDLLSKEAASVQPTQPVQSAQPAQPSPPIKLDVASVQIEKIELSYRDEVSGAQYAVSDLSLKTGRIANDVPSKIEIAAHIQANQPKLDITAQIKTTLTFDLEKNKFQVQGLDVQANGAALDITGLMVKVSGDASAQPTTKEFSLNNFMLTANGLKGKDRFEAKLVAPALSLSGENFSADGIALSAKLDAAFGEIVAALSLPTAKGNMEQFKLGALSLNVDVKQPEQAFKLKLTTPIAGNLKTQQFNLSDLVIAVNASGDKLPGKSISSELKGSVQADIGRQSIQANLAGGLLQSKIKAKAAINNFAAPAIRYDLEIDQFDADPFMPKKTAEAKEKDKKENSGQMEQPFDLSALKTLNVEGSVRIGSLKAANVRVAQLRADVKARNGMINIAPLSAKLYQGSFDGKVSVNAATSGFAVNAKLTGIDIAPLMKDALDLELAEGKGNIVLDLTTQGNTVGGLKKALNGTASVNLANGAVKGINLGKLVQGVQNLSKDTKAQTLGVDKSEKTEFSEFKASLKVRNGVAHNDDLAMKSTVLRVTGNGDIDIGHDSLNYNANATFAKTDQGKTATLPVYVSGTFDALKIKLDYAALLTDVVKQKLDEKKDEAKARMQEQLKKSLKGLFK